MMLLAGSIPFGKPTQAAIDWMAERYLESAEALHGDFESARSDAEVYLLWWCEWLDHGQEGKN